MDWRTVLREEFGESADEAFENSFIFHLRTNGRWDWDAYNRLTEAMAECCRRTGRLNSLERWLTEGFRYTEELARSWVEDGHKAYEEASLELYHLAFWFSSGSPAGKFADNEQTEMPFDVGESGGIIYRLNMFVEPSAVAELFRKAGMRRPFDDVERIGTMLANANHTLTAWDGDKLVGIARSIRDFAWCCYLSDLTVDPEYQGRGIGRELVWRTKKSVGEQVTLHLFSTPGAVEFYRHIGMENLTNGFRIVRSG
jgi:GNAT superfamily N-acetyltransferase